MKRDTTRKTFEPRRHYSSVRQQQGRVQLDSEWNEQADIIAHRLETETRDTLGDCAVPCHDDGFGIIPTPSDGLDLILHPGRAYVDGILCELDPPELPIVRFLAGGTRLRLTPGSLVEAPLAIDDWVEVRSDTERLDGSSGSWVQVTAVDTANDELDVDADVSAFDGPPNPTVRRLPTFTTQADRPVPVALPDQDGTYLAYLDVWRRHVGALEDPAIREVALGGPDSTTREQVQCQVRLLRWEGADVAEPPHCLDRPQVWLDTIAPSGGRLRARTQQVPPAPDPCEVPPGGGYTRLENQHYRVEVHTAGERDDLEIKWSRDNGSLVTPWLAQDPLDPDKLTVESLGRDTVQALAPGQWVELSDDDRELEGQAGLLVEIVDVDDPVLTIDAHGQVIDRSQFGANPKVRRWDMPDGLIAGTNAWIPLEGGIEIHLEEGEYHVGDHWLIPARAYIGERLGDIEWPRDAAGNPASKPPEGVEHHYCKLALVERTAGEYALLSDCRTQFPPLTDLVTLDLAGGDGQEAMPGDFLPCPLSVVVRNGGRPVTGRTVRFVVGNSDGGLSPALGGPTNNPILEDTTGPNGMASAFWQLPAAIPAARRCFQVEVFLLDAAGDPIAPGLRFHANQSLAREVQYDPARCQGLLGEPVVSTVQEALDALWCNASLFIAGGTGQQGPPGGTLPCALRVAVRNGRWPVEGQRVRFSFRHEPDGIDEDNGLLTPNEGDDPAADGVPELVAITDDLGIAHCFWTLPQEVAEPRRCLRVFAHLGDDAGVPIGPYVVLNADQVVPVEETGDHLRLEQVVRRVDGGRLANDSIIPLDRFAPLAGDAGINFVFDRLLEVRTIADDERPDPFHPARPNVEVEVLVPQFLTDGEEVLRPLPDAFPDTGSPDRGIGGYAPLVLNARIDVDDDEIFWLPTQSARRHLEWLLRSLQQFGIARLQVRVTLDGNFLWEDGTEPPVFLDGEAFGRFDDTGRIGAQLPTGDRRPGGTFRRWFWLIPPEGSSGPELTVITGTNQVSGVLREADGSALPGATVRLTAVPPTPAFTRVATTSTSAIFRFANVPPGTYRVTATLTGFDPLSRTVTVSNLGLAGATPTIPGVVAVNGIGSVMATRLQGLGIEDLTDLALADPDTLATQLGAQRDRVADFINQARRLVESS